MSYCWQSLTPFGGYLTINDYDDDGGDENDDVTSWLDEDQPSEDYDSESRPRQGRCNSRRSGPFMSDDEEDNDKGKQKKQSRSQNKYTSTF